MNEEPTTDTEREGRTGPGRVTESLRHNERTLLRFGAPLYAGTAVASTALSPLGIGVLIGKIAALVGFIGHGLALRAVVVTPAYREMDSLSRRFLLRWLTRVAYIAAGIWGYATFPAPLLNILTVTGTFVALTLGVGWYARWTYRRDARAIPPHPLEKVLLVALALFALTTVVVLVVSAAAAGFAISWLMEVW